MPHSEFLSPCLLLEKLNLTLLPQRYMWHTNEVQDIPRIPLPPFYFDITQSSTLLIPWKSSVNELGKRVVKIWNRFKISWALQLSNSSSTPPRVFPQSSTDLSPYLYTHMLWPWWTQNYCGRSPGQQTKEILMSDKKRGLFSSSHSLCPNAQNQTKMESCSKGQYRDKKGHLPHPSSCTWSQLAPENHSGPSHSSSVLDKPLWCSQHGSSTRATCWQTGS